MNTTAETQTQNSDSSTSYWSAWLIPLLLCGAFWPVWQWFVQRVSDRSDEPLGIVAAITLLALPMLRKDADEVQTATRQKIYTIFSAVLLVAYVASYAFAPKIIHATLALGCIATAIASLNLRRFLPGDWLLLALSLPVVASLNFYVGYPMRCVVTALSQISLRMAGLAVHAQGTSLAFGKELVEIDAPCSGIKMLWFAVFIAATLSSLFKFNTLRTTAMLVVAAIAALAGNVLRVCSLFYIETDVLSLPQIHTYEEFLHQGTGVAAFAVVATVVGGGAYFMNRSASSMATHGVAPTTAPHGADSHRVASATGPQIPPLHGVNSRSSQQSSHSHGIAATSKLPKAIQATLLILACAGAAGIPFFTPNNENVTPFALNEFPGWPETFEGERLTERPLSGMEKDFLANFPGKMATFACGNRQLILRWVTQETRQLHPSSDCFRAQGYDIKWLPLMLEGDARWSCYEASNGSQRLNVRERIFDPTGKSWSDVSSWYWAALLGQSHGPWWSITVISAPG